MFTYIETCFNIKKYQIHGVVEYVNITLSNFDVTSVETNVNINIEMK